jgi:hypothetical protein
MTAFRTLLVAWALSAAFLPIPIVLCLAVAPSLSAAEDKPDHFDTPPSVDYKLQEPDRELLRVKRPQTSFGVGVLHREEERAR